MLWKLEGLSGVLTSLLLSLESPFTMLAVLIVRDHLARLERAGVRSISASCTRILSAVQINTFVTGLHWVKAPTSSRGENHAHRCVS